MKRVYLASPYSGDVLSNTDYARRCMRDLLDDGHAPFVPHLLYTQCLDDTQVADRERGMEAASHFLVTCDLLVAYIDHGISLGMHAEIEAAHKLGVPVQMRHIGVDQDDEKPGSLNVVLSKMDKAGVKAWCKHVIATAVYPDDHEETSPPDPSGAPAVGMPRASTR